jgi:Domain of unknown function (DUF6265)
MKKLFLYLILFICLVACKKESPKKANYLLLQKANWFLGNWQNQTKEANFTEIWTKKNDSVFKGKSFIIAQKDTVFYENIELVQHNDSLFYIVSVKDQNKEKPVTFYQTSATDSKLVFENPKHNFPNKISYTKITKDSIVGEIFGLQNGKIVNEKFPMHKKQKS